MLKWRLVLVTLILLAAGGLAAEQSSAAPPAQEDAYFITSPTSSAVVSGAVEIRGTVSHPEFTQYGVFYAAGARATESSQWERIAFESQPVVNGVLAVWNTAAFNEAGQPVVPNGVYVLALARYRAGGSGPDVPLYFVENITVNNVAVTPEPTPTPEEEEIPEPTPLPGDEAPTPVPVELPPMPTERPSPTPAAVGEVIDPPPDTGAGDDSSALPIDVGELRGAFMEGARITLLLFGLWGLYVLFKAGVRYVLRTQRISLDLPLPWKRK